MEKSPLKLKGPSIQLPIHCAVPAEKSGGSTERETIFESFASNENTPTNSVTTISTFQRTLKTSRSGASSFTTIGNKLDTPDRETISTFEACRKASGQAWIAWISCDFAGVLLGYDCFYINGILGMAQFKLDFGGPSMNTESAHGFLYSNLQKAVVVSIFALGVALGAPVTGYSAERFGRRLSILAGCAVHVIGIALQLIAGSPNAHIPSITILSVGRLIGGVGLGMLSGAVVTYFNETAPKELRGAIASSYQVGLVCGICISTCINLAAKDLTDSGAYRISIGIQFLWVLILAVGIYISPETPRWFVSRRRHDEAADALSAFLGPDPTSSKVQAHLNALIDSYNNEHSGNWGSCFTGGFVRGSNLRRTMLGLLIQLGQQMTAINFMFYYGTTFFLQTKMPHPFVLVIGITIVNAVFCLVSFWTIENIGRRPLLIWGAALMAMFQLIVALLGTLTDPMTTKYVIYTFICLFDAAYASTWAPCAWAVTGDIFPPALRSKGIALGTTANWGSNFILTAITPYLVDPEYANLKEKVSYIWFTLNLVCVVYTYFEVYETKGLELEAVDRMVAVNKVSPRTSAKWIARQQLALRGLDEENKFVALKLHDNLEVKDKSTRQEATSSCNILPASTCIKDET